MEKIAAVYDVESRYVDRFADVTNQKEKVPSQTATFTSLEALKEHAKEHTIKILLISSAVLKELVKEIPTRRVVVLADGRVIPAPKECPGVYKYQSADNIIREVLIHHCEQPKAAEYMIVEVKARIPGAYFPIGRCLKTLFSWTLGQQLGKNGRMLLVNTERYSGFSRLVGEEMQPDLADAFYLYRQGNCSFARFSSMIYIWGNLDYIPPVRYPEDLGQITGEETMEFLTGIVSESSYEVLMVGMGNVGQHAISVMDACDAVYMPVRDDCVSAAKLKEFEAYLETSGKRGPLERIQRMKLPYHSGSGRRNTYLEQLVWSELGDYVRQLLKGK